jgi:hypothetical protein
LKNYLTRGGLKRAALTFLKGILLRYKAINDLANLFVGSRRRGGKTASFGRCNGGSDNALVR